MEYLVELSEREKQVLKTYKILSITDLKILYDDNIEQRKECATYIRCLTRKVEERVISSIFIEDIIKQTKKAIVHNNRYFIERYPSILYSLFEINENIKKTKSLIFKRKYAISKLNPNALEFRPL